MDICSSPLFNRFQHVVSSLFETTLGSAHFSRHSTVPGDSGQELRAFVRQILKRSLGGLQFFSHGRLVGHIVKRRANGLPLIPMEPSDSAECQNVATQHKSTSRDIQRGDCHAFIFRPLRRWKRSR